MAGFLFLISLVSLVALSSAQVSLIEGVTISNCPTTTIIGTPAGNGAFVTWPPPTATITPSNVPPFRIESLVVSYPNGTQRIGQNGAFYPAFPESNGPYRVTYAWCNERCAICQFNFDVTPGTNSNPCLPSPCINDGTCMQSVDGLEYFCFCTSGYTGRNCENQIGPTGPYDPRVPCSSSPCQNRGACASYGSIRPFYICTCFGGYTGINCQVPPGNLDPCISNPCGVNGICSAQSTGGVFTYTCNCNTGYVGLRCEDASATGPCSSSPCLNEGRCVPFGNIFVCECTSQYRGILCEQFVAATILTCPVRQAAFFRANETAPGTLAGARVTYPPAEVAGGTNYDISYSQPSGGFFPYGINTVTVTAQTFFGAFVASCQFEVTVDTEDGSTPLNPDQINRVRDNYNTLMNAIPDPELFSEPIWYSMDVVGELTAAQQQMIFEKYPDLFVDPNLARNTMMEDNINRRRRRNAQFNPARICPLNFPASTQLVIIANTDNRGHAGFESQLVRVNNLIQWAFNAECGGFFCNGVQTFSGQQQCQCCKTSRTVSALVFNLRVSQQANFQSLPMQWKQVYIYNCNGGV